MTVTHVFFWWLLWMVAVVTFPLQALVTACLTDCLLLRYVCMYHLYRYGYVIDRRRDIAIHYLKGWFTIDFISSVPIASIYEAISAASSVDGTVSEYARFPAVLRAFRAVRLIKLLRSIRMCSRAGGESAWQVRVNACMRPRVCASCARARVIYVCASVRHVRAAAVVASPHALYRVWILLLFG